MKLKRCIYIYLYGEILWNITCSSYLEIDKRTERILSYFIKGMETKSVRVFILQNKEPLSREHTDI